MSAWIKWLAFLTILFFGVGEFAGGWYVGVPPQTPIMVYKKTTSKLLTRRTWLGKEFPFKLEGKLQSGTLVVEGIYERPTSFQNPGTKSLAAKVYFTKTYSAGNSIHIDEHLKKGAGTYTLRLTFKNATGKLTVDVPENKEL